MQSQYAQQITEAGKSYQLAHQALSPFFISKEWEANWKKNPIQFVEVLHKFAADWKENQQKLSDNQRLMGEQQAEQQKIAGQMQVFASNAEQLAQALAASQKAYTDLQQQRHDLLGGKEATAVELSLQQEIEKAKTEAESAQEYIQTQKQALAEQQGTAKSVESSLSALQKDLLVQETALEAWLQHFRLQEASADRAKLLELLSYSPAWIQQERDWFQNLENARLQAQTLAEERKRNTASHKNEQTPTHTLDTLDSEMQQCEALCQTKMEEREGLRAKLSLDREYQSKAAKLLEEQRKRGIIYEDWKKLDDLLGSSDGGKFRQIAQGYTLDMLLAYANIHLADLAGRYRLQRVPDAEDASQTGLLGLQVIDQDMGDEVRSVHSLSGGESFLVSLALALALASLSSNKMNVESLFIDEGFGTLDPDTLRVVMDALERLHSQGRKVGVISHVQEMTERIQAQVMVQKQEGGKSKVVVRV